MYYLLIIIQRICDQMQKINNLKKYSSVILKNSARCSFYVTNTTSPNNSTF